MWYVKTLPKKTVTAISVLAVLALAAGCNGVISVSGSGVTPVGSTSNPLTVSGGTLSNNTLTLTGTGLNSVVQVRVIGTTLTAFLAITSATDSTLKAQASSALILQANQTYQVSLSSRTTTASITGAYTPSSIPSDGLNVGSGQLTVIGKNSGTNISVGGAGSLVGIGTSTPQMPLDVQGSLVVATGTANYGQIGFRPGLFVGGGDMDNSSNAASAALGLNVFLQPDGATWVTGTDSASNGGHLITASSQTGILTFRSFASTGGTNMTVATAAAPLTTVTAGFAISSNGPVLPIYSGTNVPACASYSGLLALTSSHVLCYCNGTNWYKLDGTTLCSTPW